MEGIVFLLIISMVVRSLYKNSKEAKKKEEARQGRGESSPPKPRSTSGFPGSLSEWVEMLEGKPSASREAPVAPRVEPAPVQPTEPVSMEHIPLPSYVPQGVSTEGCQTSPLDCEAPHSTLRPSPLRRMMSLEPVQEQSSSFSFLEGMPEVVKGVVYAEILTRPQQRRRLRP